MPVENDIAALKDRIAYLEHNRRYIQNALEMVLSLEDFYTEFGGETYTLENLLPEAKRRIDAIFPFEVLAFYMVDETDFSFRPAFWHPEGMAQMIQQEVDAMIDEGSFAWAIRERRGVTISSRDHSRQYLLHVISNHNQVKGMFGGLLPADRSSLPDTAMTLLSIILLHVANAAESMAYTNLLRNQSQLLERQVAERTRALTLSQQELEAAIERANALAEEAQAASRAKGDFLAKMSHELRTPLNGIIGMTEVALSTQLDNSQRRIIEIIGRESFSLLRQINDVLDFSKIESGKLELEQIEFNLRTLLEEVAESFVFQTAEKGIELNVLIDPTLPDVLVGDPVRLRQILLNLTGNAVKFTHKGEVFIEARPDSCRDGRAAVHFAVVDTGVGIEPQKLERVFSSFTQADNSTTRQYGGTGLGTTISKQLVELMGGRIGVDSRPGAGSTFWFTVAFERPPGRPATQPAAASLDTSMAILAVDSSTTTRRILETYLRHLGVSAVTTADGAQALTWLAERARKDHPVHAIIFDAHMPKMDGFTFTSQVRQMPACAGIPIIVMTSLKEMLTGDDCATLGFDGSLSKPIKLEALKALLNRVGEGTLNHPQETDKEAVGVGAHALGRPASERSGHILVVDDYVVNQQVAFMHLTAAGFAVDLAENGQQAVEAVGRTRYDLIFMDIQMPVLNGFDAASRIREWESGRENGRIPIIALTANAMKGDEEKCLDAGMDGYLIKPIHRHQLIKTADHWIGHRARQDRKRVPAAAMMPEKPVVSATPVMDTATALEEFGDAETVKMVAQQLIGNVTGQLETIRLALASGDRERIRKEAHAIKGGAATMEAAALSSAAAQLENLSPDGLPADLDAGFGDLESQFYRFREFVSQWKGM